MKLGTDNPVRIGVMVVLLIVAVYMVAEMLSGSAPVVTAPKATAANKTTQSAPKPTSRIRRGSRLQAQTEPLVASLDPSLRFDLLKSSEDQEYEGGKRNIFQMRAEIEIPKVIVPPVNPNPVPVKTGPPPPPPINLKFFGFATKLGEPRKVFLSSGDDVFIGGEGEVVNRRYRIVKITNTTVEIEDTLNNNKQTIPLTQG